MELGPANVTMKQCRSAELIEPIFVHWYIYRFWTVLICAWSNIMNDKYQQKISFIFF